METLFNFFANESPYVFNQWRDDLIKLAMETFSYNFKIRKDRFNNEQIATYVEAFNNFCECHKLDSVLILNSQAGFSLTRSLIEEKTRRGLTLEITSYIGEGHFERLFEHYRIIMQQHELLVRSVEDPSKAPSRQKIKDPATAA